MPFLPRPYNAAAWCIVKTTPSEPPFLIPTVPAAFEPDLVVGQHAAFLVYDHPRQFISAKVVYFGENKHGERGYVALTDQGVTVRGCKGVYPLRGGGKKTATFWHASKFGLEGVLPRTVASHRQKYPRKLPPSPSRP